MTPTTADSLKFVLSSPDFIELKNSDLFLIELKYATEENFMNENVYHEFNRAFLHYHAAEKLHNAAKILKSKCPGHKFIIYDVLRPRSVQWKLWNKVKGTHQQEYIANPERGSVHNFGMAVDLSVVNEKNEVLNMGSNFDDFIELSQPKHEEKFLANNKLNRECYNNRLLLRNCMEEAGFIQQIDEWWHFDAKLRNEVRANYAIVE